MVLELDISRQVFFKEKSNAQIVSRKSKCLYKSTLWENIRIRDNKMQEEEKHVDAKTLEKQCEHKHTYLRPLIKTQRF